MSIPVSGYRQFVSKLDLHAGGSAEAIIKSDDRENGLGFTTTEAVLSTLNCIPYVN